MVTTAIVPLEDVSEAPPDPMPVELALLTAKNASSAVSIRGCREAWCLNSDSEMAPSPSVGPECVSLYAMTTWSARVSPSSKEASMPMMRVACAASSRWLVSSMCMICVCVCEHNSV